MPKPDGLMVMLVGQVLQNLSRDEQLVKRVKIR